MQQLLIRYRHIKGVPREVVMWLQTREAAMSALAYLLLTTPAPCRTIRGAVLGATATGSLGVPPVRLFACLRGLQKMSKVDRCASICGRSFAD